MPITLQPSLPIPVEIHGKCVDVAGARAIIGCDYWQLNALVEDGSIAWAINIASADASRHELRFPTQCVKDCQAGIKRDLTAAQVSTLLFGPPTHAISAKSFYAALGMKPSHAYKLVQDGILRLAPGSTRRRGPSGSSWITWLDAIAFLTARRVL